jgi:hypothetical protein
MLEEGCTIAGAVTGFSLHRLRFSPKELYVQFLVYMLYNKNQAFIVSKSHTKSDVQPLS